MKKLHLNGPFSMLKPSKHSFLLLLLASAVVAQALGVIYTKQTQRVIHAKLQANNNLRDNLHNEWSQLLLEQGTWHAAARVERIAREQLSMVVPDKVEVLVP